MKKNCRFFEPCLSDSNFSWVSIGEIRGSRFYDVFLAMKRLNYRTKDRIDEIKLLLLTKESFRLITLQLIDYEKEYIDVFKRLIMECMYHSFDLFDSEFLEEIISSKIADKAILDSISMCFLRSRLQCENKNFLNGIIIAKQSKEHILECFYPIKCSFIWTLLSYACSLFSTKSTRVLVIENSALDLDLYAHELVSELNYVLSIIALKHPSVFSQNSLCQQIQEMLVSIEVFCPTIEFCINNHSRCELSSTLTNALIIGQVHSLLNGRNHELDSINYLFSVSPFATRECIFSYISFFNLDYSILPQEIFNILSFYCFTPSFISSAYYSRNSRLENVVMKIQHEELDQIISRIDNSLEIVLTMKFLKINIDSQMILLCIDKHIDMSKKYLLSCCFFQYTLHFFYSVELLRVFCEEYGVLESLLDPFLEILDITVISPMILTHSPMNFFGEIIEKSIITIRSMVLSLYPFCFEKIIDTPISFSILYILESLFEEQKHIQDLLGKLNEIIEYTLQIISIQTFQSIELYIRFLKKMVQVLINHNYPDLVCVPVTIFDYLVELFENSKESLLSRCFILRFFQYALELPLFLITFIHTNSYMEFIAKILSSNENGIVYIGMKIVKTIYRPKPLNNDICSLYFSPPTKHTNSFIVCINELINDSSMYSIVNETKKRIDAYPEFMGASSIENLNDYVGKAMHLLFDDHNK